MLRSLNPHQLKGSVNLKAQKLAVDVASGRQKGSLLLKHANLINVFSQEISLNHVLLAGPLIAAVGEDYHAAEAEEVIDLEGQYLAPGLIDGHMHLESSLLSPAAYAAAVVPRGVVAVVCDPHEIGNVAGVAGIKWLLAASEGLALDVWVTVSSCVPATALETSGASLGLSEIDELLGLERVLGVAEIMDFPSVIAGDEETLAKVLLAEHYRKTPEGHAPSLTGKALQSYLAAGIISDHEATTLAEGLEKLRAGVFVMIREGSVTRNLAALMPLICPEYAASIGFVTDDRLPHDLMDEGGVDFLVKTAIQAGIDPALAFRCGSLNLAKHFKLIRRGGIAAGYFADMMVLSDLKNFKVSVFKHGQKVAEAGKLIETSFVKPQPDATVVSRSVKLPALSAQDFRFSTSDGDHLIQVIIPVTGQVLTERQEFKVRAQGSEIKANASANLAKLVCVERHGKKGHVAKAFVKGFGLKAGALASSVAHDHHNILAIGMNDDDLLLACQELARLDGGWVVVSEGKVLASLPLPIAGLITDRNIAEVRLDVDRLEAAAQSLGTDIDAPFMTLSFLGLEVIPELRLTDLGLVDVFGNRLVDVLIS
ncbi:MAG: adenine deaminase [Deinococcales bacterium]